MNTFRYQSEEPEPPPGIYWRRRFLALVIGLAILAVIAWAFSGVLGASAGGSPAVSAGVHGAHPGGAASRASGPGGTPGSGAAPPSSAPSGVPSPGPALATPSPGAAPAAGTAVAGPPQACNPAAVVLTLFSGRDSYRPGQRPGFEVDVVSTSAGTCAFDVGPRYLALVITAGRRRVWSSAGCVAGKGSRLADLARGVPAVIPLAWDRETSGPGCAVTSRRAQAGSFTAAASAGGLASNPVTFRLSG